MIRPLTIATFLIACGSGLYLYESKHEVQLLDRTIERTVHETAALREQSRLLATEWNMLNEPNRLRQFSDTYLHLRPIDPKQYTGLAELDSRLPAQRSDVPASDGADDGDMADAARPGAPDAAAATEETVRPLPTVVRPGSLPARAAEHKVAEAPRAAESRGPEPKVTVGRPAGVEAQGRPAAVAEAKPVELHRSAEAHAEARALPAATSSAVTTGAVVPGSPRPIILAAPRPRPVDTPVSTQRPTSAMPARDPAPYTGSLLGMAHGSTPPAPKPTPVSTTYNAN